MIVLIAAVELGVPSLMGLAQARAGDDIFLTLGRQQLAVYAAGLYRRGRTSWRAYRPRSSLVPATPAITIPAAQDTADNARSTTH
jgi:hypothetical protein